MSTFRNREASLEDGRPIGLYRFTLGDTVWRYTSSSNDFVTTDGFVWKSAQISDDGIKQSGEAVSDVMNITAPITLGPVQVHLVTPPAQPIQVVLLRTHVDDTHVAAIWAGEVTQVNAATPGQARITCETTIVSMKREGLRLAWQRSCPYALYDTLTCRVPKAQYAVPMRIIGKSAFTVQTDMSASKPDNWFNGGFLQWLHPIRGAEFRGISEHTGSLLRIFGSTLDIQDGLMVTAYPGCARNLSDCTAKFDNLANYGGVPHMPGRSPFDGDPVFY